MEMNGRDSSKLHIPSHADNKDINSLHRELLNVIDQFYYTVERVDLSNDTMCILQCAEHPEAVSKVVNWTQYLEMTTSVFIDEYRQLVLENLSTAHLLEVYRKGETFYTVDAPYRRNGVLNTMTCFVFFSCQENEPLAYLMIRNSSRDNLRKRIIDLYIYNNCDFFICLDAKNNSYIMYNSGENGIQQPLEMYSDYMSEMEKFVNDIIVPEDRECAVRELGIERVLSQLEQQEIHSFYCGVMDPAAGYTRKRLDFRYYERGTQMILLSCTDITEMYLKEQENRSALFEALKSAETDMLTGLLNYKGTVEQISRAMEKSPEHAALLFIDIDNFKMVNDTLGHVVGDEVLCQIALILYQKSFGEPLIGRFGGDEFVVFYPNIESMEDIKAYAQQVCNAVAGMEYGQREDIPHISCSIGIVEAPKDGNDYKTLVKKADDMAYHAKFTGKNKFVIYGTV